LSAFNAAAWAQPVPLSLQDAIQRGLKYNLGVLSAEQATRSVRAERLRNLSALLPDVTGNLSEVVQQINLATFGLSFPGAPAVVGPFSYTDARASLTQAVFDWSAIKTLRSADANVRSSQFTLQDNRDLVAQAVANAYLMIIAAAARVDTSRSEVETAQALYARAQDQKRAGVVAGIDELRAQVELKSEQQRLLANLNQLAKNKLGLARIIGFPSGQDFVLTDTLPYAPLNAINLEEALKTAYATRADYQALEAQVKAAELAKQAAVAERFPTVQLNADYGDIGRTLSQSHGTFGVTGALRFPIFDGGRIRSDIEQADAGLQQKRDQRTDLRRQIDYDVRSAMLDLNSAADQVAVAQSNVGLANQTLVQARDRYTAGVADNIEVVQAQQSVAAANENYIASIYAHNLAKVALARGIGVVERRLGEYLGGK
jgi:outer membrane protein TolC